MPKAKTLEEAYDFCLANGQFTSLNEVNIEKVKSLMENAEININSALILAKAIEKNAKEWMNVFTLHYEALRIYAEALLHLEKMTTANHQGLFAALCQKFSYLDLDWDFLERIRTKRNGINYFGERVTFEDWKSVEVQIKLYLSALRKKLEERCR